MSICHETGFFDVERSYLKIYPLQVMCKNFLDKLFQGGTADEATIYYGDERLPKLGDSKPSSSVIQALESFSLKIGQFFETRIQLFRMQVRRC